ncbi:hypothetical protein IWX90DRAFT_422815 [Phyllosticta citrichinensis]|uniref:Uncharacterized protein n=1 Tax=Phyllosticta citrichinensis TaxID=1130410 RepID=A0ABR1Y970_9PEZI
MPSSDALQPNESAHGPTLKPALSKPDNSDHQQLASPRAAAASKCKLFFFLPLFSFFSFFSFFSLFFGLSLLLHILELHFGAVPASALRLSPQSTIPRAGMLLAAREDFPDPTEPNRPDAGCSSSFMAATRNDWGCSKNIGHDGYPCAQCRRASTTGFGGQPAATLSPAYQPKTPASQGRPGQNAE